MGEGYLGITPFRYIARDARFDEIPLLDDPKYKTHFTISKYVDGSFQLLNFGGSWKSLFSRPMAMDCGYYMITSGSRMSGGNVCKGIGKKNQLYPRVGIYFAKFYFYSFFFGIVYISSQWKINKKTTDIC